MTSSLRSGRRALSRRTPVARRRGMSLVELIVGIVVLTIGMLGLAGVSTVVLRQMNGSSNQTLATTLAQSRFERFEARPCASITGGTATTRGVTETWTVSAMGSRAKRVADTVRFSGVRGSVSTVGLETVVSCTP
ncbi:MAG TPA: prepilin-type N-terminal cleavage/methylation domain-containing protein [Gemmatimonadaceae bacterium]|nr:prepilin-type N-terminal cleavage/methylation domain-containing protein [Gemmatimonadaceae bacterium]